MTFGQRVLARRKELKLTQREAAKLAGVSHVTISQWERDETQPVGKRLFALSEALQCAPGWLMNGDADLPPAAPNLETMQPLTPAQLELLELFEKLPASDQQSYIESIKLKLENNRTRLYELLEAERKAKKRLKKSS